MKHKLSPGLKQKITRNFLKLKKKHGEIDAAGGTPSELKLKEYEGDVDTL